MYFKLNNLFILVYKNIKKKKFIKVIIWCK